MLYTEHLTHFPIGDKLYTILRVFQLTSWFFYASMSEEENVQRVTVYRHNVYAREYGLDIGGRAIAFAIPK